MKMTHLSFIKGFLIILMTFAFLTANGQGDDNNYLCENKLRLIQKSRIDEMPKTDYNLFIARDKICEIVNMTYDDICSFVFYFSVEHEINTSTLINIPLLSILYIDCGCTELIPPPAPFNPIPYGIHIYPTKHDTIYVMQTPTLLTEIQSRVIERYKNRPEQAYPFMRFYLYWEKELNPKVFRQVINESIFGYLSFVESESIEKFEKKICELEEEQIAVIADKIPLQFAIIVLDEMNHRDFVPWGIPPPPDNYRDDNDK
jgi:hypothetical protein